MLTSLWPPEDQLPAAVLGEGFHNIVDQFDEDLRAHRDGPRQHHVVGAPSEPERRGDYRAGSLRCRLSQGDGDHCVGPDRQVAAVLLGASDRQDDDLPLLDLFPEFLPRHVLEQFGGHEDPPQPAIG